MPAVRPAVRCCSIQRSPKATGSRFFQASGYRWKVPKSISGTWRKGSGDMSFVAYCQQVTGIVLFNPTAHLLDPFDEKRGGAAAGLVG